MSILKEKIDRFLLEANELDQIADIVKNNKFLDLRKDLLRAKFKVDFVFSPVPHYRIKSGGKTIVIVNKKYADKADKIVGDIAIGFEGKI